MGIEKVYRSEVVKKITSSALGLVLVILLIGSMISPQILLYAENQSSGGSTVYQNMIIKAQILREILNGSLVLNLSSDIKNQIVNLLSINISSLTTDQLDEWVKNASKTLASIEEYVRSGRAYSVGQVAQRYLGGLTRALENRFRELNLSREEIEDYIKNLSSARDANEYMKRLHNISIDIEIKNIERAARAFIEMKVRVIETGSIEGIKPADNDSLKVVSVLERVYQHLLSVNASERALEAVRENIERIEILREYVSSVAELAKKKSIEEASNETLLNVTARLISELTALQRQAEELIELATLANNTLLLSKLREINNTITQLLTELQNTSHIKNLVPIIMIIARVKIELQNINQSLSSATVEILKSPEIQRDIDKMYNETLNKVMNLTKVSNDLLGKIRDIKNSICTNTTRETLEICKTLDRFLAILSLAEDKINETKILAEQAQKLYSSGEKIKALETIVRAKGIITSVYEQLEKIYETLSELISKQTSTPTHTTHPRKP
ncbi:MAG: hypothetical protein ABWJ42_06675 [Sulfolobales archaeon]